MFTGGNSLDQIPSDVDRVGEADIQTRLFAFKYVLNPFKNRE